MAKYLIMISIKQWEAKFIQEKLYISDNKMIRELNPNKNVFLINAGLRHKEKVNIVGHTKLSKMKKLKIISQNYIIKLEKKNGLYLFIN
jgi:hypothetical protein